MGFGCVPSHGEVSPPHISDGYVELRNTVVNLWFKDYMRGNNIQLTVIPPRKETSGCQRLHQPQSLSLTHLSVIPGIIMCRERFRTTPNELSVTSVPN